MKKINPRRIPKTQADVEAAKKIGYICGAEFTANLHFFILANYFGWSIDQIKEMIEHFDFYCSQIGKNELSYNEVKDVNKKEYNFDVTMSVNKAFK